MSTNNGIHHPITSKRSHSLLNRRFLFLGPDILFHCNVPLKKRIFEMCQPSVRA